MEENEDLINLLFASVLHDIGKFWQRTWEFPHKNHSELGAMFAERLDMKVVGELIMGHHTPTSACQQQLARIIQQADHISSREREEHEGTQQVREEPLQAIFSAIDIGKGNGKNSDAWFYHVAPLNLKKETLFPVNDKQQAIGGQTLDAAYKNLWNNGFVADLDSITLHKDRASLRTLYHLLHRYTSYIPSAAWKSKPDISLFDHLRTTAAITHCLNHTNAKDNFLLVSGDISGIQSFLYDIFSPDEAQKGMSKRLRGRSFYLTVLTETLAHHILQCLGLTRLNILWCGGGVFQIIAPDTETIRSTVNELRDHINSFLLREYAGRLYLALEYQPCDGASLQDAFPQVIEKVTDKLSTAKEKKFSEILSPDFFQTQPSRKICRVCGKDMMETDERICADCHHQEKLGGQLPKTAYIVEIASTNGQLEYQTTLEFPAFNISWEMLPDERQTIEFIRRLEPEKDIIESVMVYRLNNTDFLTAGLCRYVEDSDLPISLGFKFLGNTVPYDGHRVLMFSEMAEQSRGINLLGTLRMDVDDLGAIFGIGLQERGHPTISRIATMSRQLDLFFLGYLNRICERYKTDDEALPLPYITYSGGDDIFIVAPWNIILELAEDIYDEFREYTCGNPNITLSAGIFNFKPKYPIGRAADYAGMMLDGKAKELGKDMVTVFGETVKWNTDSYAGVMNGYHDLLSYGKQLEEYVSQGYLSKAFIRALLNFWRETFYGHWREYGFTSPAVAKEKKRYMPHFKYLLARSVDKKRYPDLFNDLDEHIPKIIPWARIPVSWVSYAKR